MHRHAPKSKQAGKKMSVKKMKPGFPFFDLHLFASQKQRPNLDIRSRAVGSQPHPPLRTLALLASFETTLPPGTDPLHRIGLLRD